MDLVGKNASHSATVADAMIHSPTMHGPATTVAQARELFCDDHMHALLIVDSGELLAVVQRPDITAASQHIPAHLTGRLRGRITGPCADLDATLRTMTTHRPHQRRLAVIDDHRRLLGLLCLKRTGAGFCSDADVDARATEHAASNGTQGPNHSAPSAREPRPYVR